MGGTASKKTGQVEPSVSRNNVVTVSVAEMKDGGGGSVAEIERAETSMSTASQSTSMSASTAGTVGESDKSKCSYYFHKLCSANSSSKRGQRVQMIRVLFLIFLPVIGVTGYALNHLIDAVRLELSLKDMEIHVEDGHSVGDLIHGLQLERSKTLLYLTSNGSSMDSATLRSAFNYTNIMISRVKHWPDHLPEYPQFNSRISFNYYLEQERLLIQRQLVTISESIVFYNQANDVFVEVLQNSLATTVDTKLWKYLVAYKLLVMAKENYGVTMAVGLEYYSLCHITEQERIFYIQNDALALDHMKTAQHYDAEIKDYYNGKMAANPSLTLIQEDSRIAISTKAHVNCSLEESLNFYNISSLFIDILYDVNYFVEKQLLDEINYEHGVASQELIIAIAIFLVLFIISPILVMLVYRMTSEVQAFAKSVNEKSTELAIEKKRANRLLFTMLPKDVAMALINNTTVSPQYYDDVTIYFSDVVGFTKLSTISTPLQIVDFLNSMYTFFDEKIDQYDAYKVETIGDAYMVASGLPRRNGRRHAGEIGGLALTLLEGVENFSIPHLPKEKLRLRIGLHTGPVCAGVVGLKMPRYCLFGDTVNTASRMESHGQPLRVHISRSCKLALESLGGFRITPRGSIEVKGKGQMDTYWLDEKDVNVKPKTHKSALDD